jgi:hypothetical protein
MAMGFDGPGFVIAIIVVCTVGWLVNNFIRARHGYALEDEWGGKTALPRTAEVEDLRNENARLAARIGDYEQRLHALEAIVTDKGYDVSLQIEALRDAREPVAIANGSPAGRQS